MGRHYTRLGRRSCSAFGGPGVGGQGRTGASSWSGGSIFPYPVPADCHLGFSSCPGSWSCRPAPSRKSCSLPFRGSQVDRGHTVPTRLHSWFSLRGASCPLPRIRGSTRAPTGTIDSGWACFGLMFDKGGSLFDCGARTYLTGSLLFATCVLAPPVSGVRVTQLLSSTGGPTGVRPPRHFA